MNPKGYCAPGGVEPTPKPSPPGTEMNGMLNQTLVEKVTTHTYIPVPINKFVG